MTSTHIEHTFYINLDRATINRDRMEAVLTEYALSPYERFPGTVNGYGYIGATISHLQALKQAKVRGYRNILIFEDDFEFLHSKQDVDARLDEFFGSDLVADYDVLMFGCWTNRGEPTGVAGIERALDAQAFSGYLVHERYYDTLITVIEEGLTRLVETHEHWNYMVDQIVKRSQPHSRWYYFVPRIGKQMDREF